MLSNVKCYKYGMMGHMHYHCTIPSRRAAGRVENGRGILPIPPPMGTNQNGKRSTEGSMQETKKPAVGDGAKYSKPYWLVELEKVKERWGPGVDANKGTGEDQKSEEGPGQVGPSTKRKAPIWMATGIGGFINMNGHGDGRIVELGPTGNTHS